jgi:hypothetical protein
MKLAYRAYAVTLLLLTLVFAVSGQGNNARSANDPRNPAPTVGTGGPTGGPTGLFTVYDGQVLRKGEFTFSAAYSNYDRDPGNVDITEVPLSFQVGATDHIELFFSTTALRGVKVNSPRNLSSFYLPNSRVNFISPPAIVLAPQGPGASQFPNAAVFRPTGSQPWVQFPFIGGPTGNFGLQSINAGTVFGFGTGPAVITVRPGSGGGAADVFPGMGSPYGSILPGVVLTTVPLPDRTGQLVGEGPSVFTVAPTYLPDAPFINRTYGTSSFNDFTFGGKFRFTGPTNPIGIALIAYWRWWNDHADDFAGFNMLQRGAGPGGNRGDIAVYLAADARLKRWANLSANVGYIYNSSVKADFPGGRFTILDRGDEFIAALGADFPVNKFFQPILEFRTLQYVGGRTPNAFENNPIEGLAGVRIFPARWFGIGLWYRHHFNQQDRDSFDEDDTFTTNVTVNCTPGGTGQCAPVTIPTTFSGIPPGFAPSDDPHGFGVQIFAGRRNKRQAEVINKPANVTSLTVSDTDIKGGCEPGFIPRAGEACNESTSVSVTTTAVDPENDVLTYRYTVSAGRIVGSGATVSWDLSGVQAGSYTITAAVDDGCGFCGETKTETVRVSPCECVRACACPDLSISGPAGITAPGGTMVFTASASGGSQDTPITYNWTVSPGTIVSGQGTPSITVQAPSDESGGNVTATVEIGGVPPNCGCRTSASETAPYQARETYTEVDTFGKLPNDEVKARVQNFYTQLANNPTAQGYIINYGTPREITARRKQITDAIRFLKLDPSRVTFVDGGNKGTGVETHFFIVPPNVTPPQP